MAKKKILVIDDEEGMVRMVRAVLEDADYEVTTYTDSVRAVAAYLPGSSDLVITDIKMAPLGGLEVLDRVKAADPAVPVIMITAHATVDTSIQALRRGAYDMLTKPFEPEELIHRVENALRHSLLLSENDRLKSEIARLEQGARLIGAAPGFLEVVERARKVAAREIPVLLTGESGTGKELVAREIHAHSPRRSGKFVAINCGALPGTLLESELFGSRKGAFTGASAERAGLIKAADGGTLFLDEVGTLPQEVQKVFLRFLQEKEYYRLGDTEPTRVDVRIISATNADLEEAVRSGEFREDLFYRLAVARIALPPLRERPGDVELLAGEFVAEQNRKFSTQVGGVTPEALAALTAHPWPGNVRQLKNVIEAAMAVGIGDRIELSDIAQFLKMESLNPAANPPQESGGAGEDYPEALARFEAGYFADHLRRARGSVEEAARQAGVNLATYYRKIKKYDLKR